MADATFHVVFDGQLADGADPGRVKADVAKLFKTDVAKVEPLFSGRRAVVKRGLDEATARKYQAALERVGALVTVVDGADPEPATAQAGAESQADESQADETQADEPQAQSAGVEDGEATRSELAEAGRAPPPLVTRGTPSAPEDMSMAEAGALLVEEPATVEAPDIDTSHLTLSEPGADLGEHRQVVAPEFDLSGLELAPPGTTLADPDAPRRG